MDRLSAVRHAGAWVVGAALTAGLAGCEREGGDEAPASEERVAAVRASQEERSLAELCDVMPKAGDAPELSPPSLSADSEELPEEGWRWINVWATWCDPCVEEIPMLREWADRSGGEASIEVVFVSVDESAEVIETHLETNPDAPTRHRLSNPETLTDWVADVGLESEPILPLHIVVDPSDRVRCVRNGKISERDLPLAERLVAGDE